MSNCELDLAIATEVCGYPKDGWRATIHNDVCYLVKRKSNVPCEVEWKKFSPTSDWALAGKLLEEYCDEDHKVDLEILLLNKLPLKSW